MNFSNYCIVLDSGIGGLSIALKIDKLNMLYLADSKYAPYGQRSYSFLKERLSKIIDYFYQKNARLFLLACNTLTTLFIDLIRKKYPDCYFIGVVPPIKPALSSGKSCIILSSSKTENSDYLDKLVNKFADKKQVFRFSSSLLVKEIEKANLLGVKKELKRIFKPFSKNKPYALVLGCTHFSLIKKEIKEIIGKNTFIYEPTKGTVKQFYQVAGKFKVKNPNQLFMTSADPVKIERAVSKFTKKKLSFQKLNFKI